MNDELFALKAAFRRLVKAAGGVESAETVAGVSKASLSKWQSVDHDCTAPLHVVMALEKDVGSPIVTRDMLRLHGFVAVSAQEAPQSDSLHGLLLHVAKELGEAVSAIGEMNHFPSTGVFQAVEREVFDVKTAADKLLDETRRRRPGLAGALREVS